MHLGLRSPGRPCRALPPYTAVVTMLGLSVRGPEVYAQVFTSSNRYQFFYMLSNFREGHG